nr:hydroxymethylglutaryl-CoA lyase [Thermaerobacter sp.]
MKARVDIVEVTPRDGLQDVKPWVDTATKMELIQRLVEAHATWIEVTAFVSPVLVPQMADAEDVMAQLPEGAAEWIGLIPNLRGYERARRVRTRHLTYVVSASPRHQQDNVRRPLSTSLQEFGQLAARQDGPALRGAISCAFGSPYAEEVIHPQTVAAIARQYRDYGAAEVVLADTVGAATPDVVRTIVAKVQDALGGLPVAVHFHDRLRQGRENVREALALGVRRFEAALAGLGGCPFAPQAPGNLNTIRLATWLDEWGYETGLDLFRLEATEKWLGQVLALLPQG